MDVYEIYNLLEAKPGLLSLFQIIKSFPPERREQAMQMALDFLAGCQKET